MDRMELDLAQAGHTKLLITPPHVRFAVIGTAQCGKTQFMNRFISYNYSVSTFTIVKMQATSGEACLVIDEWDNGVSTEKIIIEIYEINDEMIDERKRRSMIQASQAFFFIFKCSQRSEWDAIQIKMKEVARLKGSEIKQCTAILLGIRENNTTQNDDEMVLEFARAWTRKGFEMSGRFANPACNCIKLYFPILLRRSQVLTDELNSEGTMDVLISPQSASVFDMLVIIITLADIATDVWVLYQWYSQSRWIPFYISLSILITAQIAYVCAFIARYTDSHWSCSAIFCRLLPLILPMAPLLSFVMFFASDTQGWLYGFMKDRGFSMGTTLDRADKSKIEIFVRETRMKYMGFLLEAGVEAFPQSILQMSVMVWFSEANWVSIVSILLSLISVCSKSFAFSIVAFEVRSFFFNYLSIVLDFISMLSLISWLFYHPSGCSKSLSGVAQFYIFKVLTITLPIVAGTGLLFSIEMWADSYGSNRRKFGANEQCGKRLLYCCFGMLIFVGWILGTVIGTLMLEMCCCSGFALLLFSLVEVKFKTYDAQSILWGKVIAFIDEGHNWDDKRLRVCLANDLFIKKNKDEVSREYFKDNRPTLFSRVTWKGIRQHMKPENVIQRENPLKKLIFDLRDDLKNIYRDSKEFYFCDWSAMKQRWNADGSGPKSVLMCPVLPVIFTLGIFFWLPLFVITRVMNFFFVWFLVIRSVWILDNEEIAPLQVGLAIIQVSLQLLWLILLVSVLRLNYLMWHILPSEGFLFVDCGDETVVLGKMRRLKHWHKIYSQESDRNQAVIDFFGSDIGSVLLLYLPTLLSDMDQ